MNLSKTDFYIILDKHEDPKDVCSVIQLQRCNWITGTDSHVCTEDIYVITLIPPLWWALVFDSLGRKN